MSPSVWAIPPPEPVVVFPATVQFARVRVPSLMMPPPGGRGVVAPRDGDPGDVGVAVALDGEHVGVDGAGPVRALQVEDRRVLSRPVDGHGAPAVVHLDRAGHRVDDVAARRQRDGDGLVERGGLRQGGPHRAVALAARGAIVRTRSVAEVIDGDGGRSGAGRRRSQGADADAGAGADDQGEEQQPCSEPTDVRAHAPYLRCVSPAVSRQGDEAAGIQRRSQG